MTDNEADKSALRTLARADRRSFVQNLDALAHRLSFKILPSPLVRILDGSDIIALYIGIDGEAPAERLANQLIEKGKTLALPRVMDRLGTMDFIRWNPGETLITGHFGTQHPDPNNGSIIPDAIIAPLVGFDRHMTRLGQGGGYYDRIFARHPDALRIGLAWSVQEHDLLPSAPWDLPLHMIMTEKEFIEGSE